MHRPTSWGRIGEGGRGGGCSLPGLEAAVKFLEQSAHDLGTNTWEKALHCCLRDFQNSLE